MRALCLLHSLDYESCLHVDASEQGKPYENAEMEKIKELFEM